MNYQKIGVVLKILGISIDRYNDLARDCKVPRPLANGTVNADEACRRYIDLLKKRTEQAYPGGIIRNIQR